MLELTRKKNETINIGKDIVITELETTNEQVKLRIDAPRNIGVMMEGVSFEDIQGMAEKWLKRS